MKVSFAKRAGILGATIAFVYVITEGVMVERQNAAVVGSYEWPNISTTLQWLVFAAVVIAVGYLVFFGIGSLVMVVRRRVT